MKKAKFKMYAEFGDKNNPKGYYFYGEDEDDCMYQIFEAAHKNNVKIQFYTGVCDDYYEDGEYIPSCNECKHSCPLNKNNCRECKHGLDHILSNA